MKEELWALKIDFQEALMHIYNINETEDKDSLRLDFTYSEIPPISKQVIWENKHHIWVLDGSLDGSIWVNKNTMPF